MSKLVNVDYECPACESNNTVPITKPNVITPAFKWITCEVCKSKWFVRFKKRAGENQVDSEVIKKELSKDGKVKYDLRLKELNKPKTKTPAATSAKEELQT